MIRSFLIAFFIIFATKVYSEETVVSGFWCKLSDAEERVIQNGKVIKKVSRRYDISRNWAFAISFVPYSYKPKPDLHFKILDPNKNDMLFYIVEGKQANYLSTSDKVSFYNEWGEGSLSHDRIALTSYIYDFRIDNSGNNMWLGVLSLKQKDFIYTASTSCMEITGRKGREDIYNWAK